MMHRRRKALAAHVLLLASVTVTICWMSAASLGAMATQGNAEPPRVPRTRSELLVDATGHLAWPVFGLIVLAFLRPHLAALFVKIKAIEAVGLHFELERGPTGLQFTAANRRIYYFPIYPQMSWQNTGIRLRAQDQIQVDLYGWVSPGGFVDLGPLKDHMDKFVEWQLGTREKPPSVTELPQWRYTGPEGYDPAWYEGSTKLPVMASHKVYQQDRYYEKDMGLTVRGLPHNIVIGTIAPEGQRPRSALGGAPGYEWPRDRDESGLINLSRSHAEYPINLEARTAGYLWVVINDVDECRWDNSGLFFMTVVVTHKEERRKAERRQS